MNERRSSRPTLALKYALIGFLIPIGILMGELLLGQHLNPNAYMSIILGTLTGAVIGLYFDVCFKLGKWYLHIYVGLLALGAGILVFQITHQILNS